jgi:tetratricopeptide (TPR) repeat protein
MRAPIASVFPRTSDAIAAFPCPSGHSAFFLCLLAFFFCLGLPAKASERSEVMDEITALVDKLAEAGEAPEEGGTRQPAKPADATPEKPASEAPAEVEEAAEDLKTSVHGEKGEKAWEGVAPLDKAAFFHQQGDLRLAEKTYRSVLESDSSREDRIRALLEMAEVYRDRGILTRAVEKLETCLREYPEIAERPEILFRLGEFYREMDLHRESIAMLYRVLNAIVVTGEQDLDAHLRLARRAQFEIARTHLETGDSERAYLLFDRIDLLELNPDDRKTVLYYKTVAALKAGKNTEGLRLVQRFVNDYPESEFLPEMLYLEAEVLYRLDRSRAAVESLLRLLETVGEPREDSSGDWSYWRKKTGNRLANRLYTDGDYLMALRLYQGMVGLKESAAWQLPIIYQIGLCFEKLNMLDRAEQSYAYLLDQVKGLPGEDRDRHLQELADNAGWRLDVLQWRENLKGSIRDLAYEERAGATETELENES